MTDYENIIIASKVSEVKIETIVDLSCKSITRRGFSDQAYTELSKLIFSITNQLIGFSNTQIKTYNSSLVNLERILIRFSKEESLTTPLITQFYDLKTVKDKMDIIRYNQQDVTARWCKLINYILSNENPPEEYRIVKTAYGIRFRSNTKYGEIFIKKNQEYGLEVFEESTGKLIHTNKGDRGKMEIAIIEFFLTSLTPNYKITGLY